MFEIDLIANNSNVKPLEGRPSISFLLGSGFSVAADCPTKSDLNDVILDYAKNKNLKRSFSGVLCSKDYNNYGFSYSNQRELELLFAVILEYKRQRDFDYEVFYDYLKNDAVTDKKLHKRLSSILEFSELGVSSDIRQLETAYNQLVAYSLIPKGNVSYYDIFLKNENIRQKYCAFKKFIYKILKSNQVHIHTLNHDLLLEELLRSKGYSDGFTKNDSSYYGKIRTYSSSKKVLLPFYNGEYDLKKPCIYKIHGSLDYYRFYENSKLSVLKAPYGIDDSTFEKTLRDTSTIRDIGNFHPMFLTGVDSKKEMYIDNPFYKNQISNFQNNISNCACLFIIGYSFGDKEINNILFNCNTEKCIVINPDVKNDLMPNFMYCKPVLVKRKIEEIQVHEYEFFSDCGGVNS